MDPNSSSNRQAQPEPLLLVVEQLVKHYPLPRERLFEAAPRIEALGGVSFAMRSGTSLGLVGESGSGKSTLARLVMALEAPTSGRITLLGRDLHALAPRELRAARRDFQMVFQDPYGSLDPRQRVGRIVAEPLAAAMNARSRDAEARTAAASPQDAEARMAAASPRDAEARVAEALEAVGLRPSDADKYPHEFSGGQRQRIAIARALITRPRLIVADEPVSALDVSVQAQVLNLLQDLQREFGVTYLLISHDIAVVDHLCDEVAVLYAGRIVEQGSPEVLFRHAGHPYTRALMAAVQPPDARSRRVTASTQTPGVAAGTARTHPASAGPEQPLSAHTNAPLPWTEPAAKPMRSSKVAPRDASLGACPYAPRCPYRQALCSEQAPALRALAHGHLAACHFAEQVIALGNPFEDST